MNLTNGEYALIERFVKSQERIAELFEKSVQASIRIAAAQEENNELDREELALRRLWREEDIELRAEDLERYAANRAADIALAGRLWGSVPADTSTAAARSTAMETSSTG